MSSDRRQIAWGLVDQGLSSVTNFGGSVLAARTLSTDKFGAFAVGFAVYLIALGVSRAWSSEPLVVRSSAASPIAQRLAIQRASSAAIVVGCGAGIVLCVVALATPTSLRGTLFVVGLFLPALLLQDFCRFGLIVMRRSSAAALNDLVWLLVMLIAFAFGSHFGHTAASAMLCWVVGAAAGAFLGLWQLRVVPHRRVLAWFVTNRDLSWRYVVEFLLVTGVSYSLTIGVAAVGALDDAGEFRAAQVLLGPLNVVFIGMMMQTTPILVRRSAIHRPGLPRLGLRLSAGLAGFALVWGTLIVALPDHLGTTLLGASWTSSQRLVPVLALTYVMNGISSGANAGLRALGDARSSLKARAIVAPASVVLGGIGAATNGPFGAALGLLISSVLGVPVWWLLFRRSVASAPISALRVDSPRPG